MNWVNTELDSVCIQYCNDAETSSAMPLTLGELELLTGFLLTEFLTFHHSGIPGQ